MFCDSCSDYRLLSKDPKDRTVIVSARACRSCFDANKGRRRRAPVKSTPKLRPSTAAKIPTTVFSPKTEPQERAAYYVKAAPTAGAGAAAAAGTAPPSGEAEAETDDGDSGEDRDEVIIEDDEEEEEYDYSFPLPLPSPLPPMPTIHDDPTQLKDASAALPSPSLSKPSTRPAEGKGDERAAGAVGDKDEFERAGEDNEGRAGFAQPSLTPREAELLAIPADALASVKHSAQAQASAGLPVVHSAEPYSERNVVKRHIVPPSPIVGVRDLMELTSPSTVPQPLLNTLNAQAEPAVVANLVEALVEAEDANNQRGAAAPPMFSPRTGLLLSKAATKAPAPSPHLVIDSTTTAASNTLPPVGSAAPDVQRTSAAELVDVVMEDARLTQSAPSNARTSASEQRDGRSAVDGVGSARGRRSAAKPKGVRQAQSALSALLRPVPLGLLAAGFLLLFALLPLSATLPLSVALFCAPLLYAHFFLDRSSPAPRLSVSRDFPALAAEHRALLLQQRLAQWERAEQRLDGLAALPSPSLTQHYASQTDAVGDSEQGQDKLSGVAVEAVAPTSRPRMVI